MPSYVILILLWTGAFEKYGEGLRGLWIYVIVALSNFVTLFLVDIGVMAGRHGTSEWARCIAELRRDLQLTQTELADQVGVTAMTVSRWERGLVEPTASGYISLGNLSESRRAWFFWLRAGLDKEKLRRALRGSDLRSRGH